MALRQVPNVWVYQCKIGGKTWSRSTDKINRRAAERYCHVTAPLVRLDLGGVGVVTGCKTVNVEAAKTA